MLQNIALNTLGYAGKLLLYSNISKSYVNMEAIFSDETENFVSKIRSGKNIKYEIKLRTAKNNVDHVYLHYNDKKKAMTKSKSDNIFDYYTISVDFKGKRTKYHFSIEKNENIYYYNKNSIRLHLDKNFNFVISPNFDVPEWSKGAIIYQIFVDRFCNGDTSNDVETNEYTYLCRVSKKIEDWNEEVSQDDICNFYGGDLKGIMDKFPYLKDLGVDVIFLNPIFVSPSNHKYDAQDYDYIDPHYAVIAEDGGKCLEADNLRNKFATKYLKRTLDKKNLDASNEFFIKFMKTAHSHGIKVIIDGVFNHCGAFNKWLDKEGFYQQSGYSPGAYSTENSPYKDYFKWYTHNWPNNDCYDSWWGHDNHPKLNFEASQELYDYFMNIGSKWVSAPYNADGWRLDVAADLGFSQDFNHTFWRDFRKSVKGANPEAIILAEHYGNAEPWLEGDQWDTIMNYDAFMEPITWFLTGMQKHSEEFREDMLCNAMAFEGSMRFYMSRFSIETLHSAMNQLSNHDHSRFLTRTNMKTGRLHTEGATSAQENINKGIMYEAVTFQMTWPGAPTLYYGDEAGLAGWTDPDNRRTYPWGREDAEILNFHHEIIKIRKNLNCMKKGSLEYLYLDYGILSYARWDENQKVVVVLNNNSVQKQITMSLWKVHVNPESVMVRLIESEQSGFNTHPEEYAVSGGKISITLKPYSSMVLKELKGDDGL